MSLKEQLLKAGLIDEKQARQAEHRHKQKNKQQPRDTRQKEKVQAAETVRKEAETQKARDKALNRERQENQATREKSLQESARALSGTEAAYKEGTLKAWGGNRRYYYLHGTVVDYMLVNEEAGRKLEQGLAAIVKPPKGKGAFILVTSGAAKRLLQLEADRVITYHQDRD